MTDRLNARCHCGKVHLTLPATAAGVLACHCDDCQKMHGNFNAFLAVPVVDVEATGTEHLVWYQSSAAARRAFCGTCGSRVVKEITAAGRWLVSAGLVDGPTGKRIIKNLWEQSKPDW
ncbi:MAG: GFA family protein, partial [Allorhizobium sp.]